MMKKIRKKILNFIKQNKILTIASIVFIIASGVNTYLIYNFVQVLENI